MYDGIVAVLPTGRAGMVAHENRLFSSAIELLDAQGVTFEDRHIRKEAGVSNLDANGVGSAPAYAGTLSSADQWGAILAVFPGSGIATHGNTVSADKLGGGNTKVVFVPTGGWSAGSLVVLCVAVNSGSDPDCHVTSISDTKGNTYTPIDDGFGNKRVNWAQDGNTALWYSRLTTTLNASDPITLIFSSSGIAAHIVGAAYSGITGNHLRQAMSASTSPSGSSSVVVGPTAPVDTLPLLLITGVGCPNGTTSTPGGGHTERVEASSGGGNAALNHRIDTTSSNIIAIHDWHSGVIIQSGGTFKAAATQGGTIVTGSGGTLWNTGTEAQRIFPGDRIRIYTASNIEERVVLSVASDTSLTVTEAFAATFAASDYLVIRGPRLITATTGGSIFKERGGDLDAVALAGNLSQTARPGKFIVCGKEDGNLQRKLMYLNGHDVPRGLVDDGASMAAISGPNADWDGTATNAGSRPWTGCMHRDRVVVACPKGKDPHRLYLSSPTNHGDFATAGSATTRRVRSDIGDEVWGLASFQGVLWVWKYPVGIFYIDDSDLDPTNWVERTKSQAVGCAPSPYAVCPMDDDVLFMSATGAFHVLSAVDALGGVKASDLSWHLGLNKWLRENLNLSRLNQTLSVWYPHKKVALFSVPSAGSTVNDLMLKWDFSGVEAGEPAKFSYSRQTVPDAIALRRDSDGVWKPVIGQGVHVKLLERDARNNGGSAYTAQYQTPHIDFSHVDPSFVHKRKLFEHLELLMEPVSAGTLTVEVYVDGAKKGPSLTFDATKRRQRKKLNVGDGHTISLKITNAVLDEDFKVLAHLVYFRPGNEDYSR